MGAWKIEYLQVLVRQPAEVGSKLWNAYKSVVIKGIKGAFKDIDTAKRLSNEMEYLKATEQGGENCVYPADEEYEEINE